MTKSQIIFTKGAEYPYNVQILEEINGAFVYCGNGKFFKTKAEALEYMDGLKDKRKGGRPRKDLLNKAIEEPQNGIYYTAPEVADLLGVHIKTVRARLRDGTIQGKKVYNEWRIYKSEILRLQEERN